MANEQLSPMMQHYLKTKEEYPDSILFYRLGDFYEMFFEDAVEVSRELELTLTGKDCGLAERAPMCGVPYHAASVYISRLIDKGYKVAICEQTEDPKLAKGMVKREVVRVVTPGTVVDEELLDEKTNNYLAVIFTGADGKSGFSVSDVSTGEIYTAELSTKDEILNETARFAPKEIVANSLAVKSLANDVDMRFHMSLNDKNDSFFEGNAEEKVSKQFGKDISELNLGSSPNAVKAVGAMLNYLEYAQKTSIDYLDKLTVYSVNQYMELDAATRRNLEVTETMRDRAKRGSILWVLDRTNTSMGARLLKQWAERPLISADAINKRLYSVKELYENMMLRGELSEVLSRTYDISRIISRLSLGSATPKDMASLRETLIELPALEYALKGTKSPILAEMSRNFDLLEDVRDLLERAIKESPSPLLKDGNIINDGFNEELDKLRRAKENGGMWLHELEQRERERTGIPKLKTGFNKVFGYYIEITNSYKDLVPEDYIRKQTLTNCERYITPELKELENTILGASEKILNLESYLFDRVRKSVVGEIDRLRTAADIISVTDALYSLAESASRGNFCMPSVSDSGVIDIKEGRHPVVEKMSKNSMFVPNDTLLDCDENRMIMLTGPNMAGKSTYMRQVAVITLMAQMGSFVPAKSAKIGIVDRIFTRVGASDDIASGQSTFMLEMNEVSNILKYATKNSLIILDEIGRGTSTFDGLSIAWAVAEYILSKKKIGAKTLFATHYHELTGLEGKTDGVKNYCVAVKKRGDDITFLRKIIRGGTDDSYGVEVAALAGLPKEVISRAKEILKKVESDEISSAYKNDKKEEDTSNQIGFADTAAAEIANILKETDVTTFTPIEALNMLYKLSEKAKEI